MKKYKYLVRDLDLFDDNTNELEERLAEYGNHGFRLIVSERFVIFENSGEQHTYFRCVFIKEFVKDMDKDEDGYEELFK